MTRYVVIRADDCIDTTSGALDWFTQLIISKGIKATFACIPNKLTSACITYLNGLNPANFEMCQHGWNHDGGDDEVAIMFTARAKMIQMFGVVPKTIGAPNALVPDGYTEQAELLGFNSMINFPNFKYPPSIYNFPYNLDCCEDSLATPKVFYDLNTLKYIFNTWYAGTVVDWWYWGYNHSRVFTIIIHPEWQYADVQARADFASLLDYIITKGDVVFLTEEGAVQTLGGTGHPKLVTVFSDGFESGDFSNPSGVGGAWTTYQALWSVTSSNHHTGSYCAVAGQNNNNERTLGKSLNLTGLVVFDYWLNIGAVNDWGAVGQLFLVSNNISDWFCPFVCYNGHMGYIDTGGFHNLPTDTTYGADEWHHIVIHFDVPMGIFTWTIDGSYKGVAHAKSDGNGVISTSGVIIDTVNFMACSDWVTGWYLDDIVISQANFLVPVKAHHYQRGD